MGREGQGAVLLLHPCALARRRRGGSAVSVRARGAPQSSRHLPADGQRPRVDRGRGSTAGSVSARAWRPDGPGGSGWMRRRRTSAARPHDFSRAHARPPPAAQREPVPGEVVGRDSSRGQPSPKFDAGRAGCKVAAATDSDGWVASRLRAARACHLGTSVRACALGWRRSPRELSGCSERRTIDLPSSGVPSRTPGLCTSSSGRLRAAALVILPGGPGT